MLRNNDTFTLENISKLPASFFGSKPPEDLVLQKVRQITEDWVKNVDRVLSTLNLTPEEIKTRCRSENYLFGNIDEDGWEIKEIVFFDDKPIAILKYKDFVYRMEGGVPNEMRSLSGNNAIVKPTHNN